MPRRKNIANRYGREEGDFRWWPEVINRRRSGGEGSGQSMLIRRS